MKRITIAAMALLLCSQAFSQDRHMFFVWADAQVYEDKELEYVRTAAADMKAVADAAGVECFAVHVGDLIGEFGESPDFKTVSEACESSGIPFRYVVGNHDLDHKAETLDGRKAAWRGQFGQNYYSFDMGKVHYVVLDDVDPTGNGWQVRGYIDPAQLKWLRRDLAKVRKGSTVVVFAHIPTWSREARNGDFDKEEASKTVENRQALYDLLKPFDAHICTGHEHYAENYVLGDHLMEHVHAPLSGVFWQSLWSCDGLPWGYYVYEVDGNEISWYYKAVGESRDEQFTIYRPGEDPARKESVVANVWNWDPEWKVEWSEDGRPMGEMTRCKGWDRTIVDDVEFRRDREFKWKYVGAGQTEHLFYATPSTPDAHVEVTVTDRFGRRYTKDGNYNFCGIESTAKTDVPEHPIYGRFKGTDKVETDLYNLALDEMVQDIEDDGTFRTGELWGGVWTRDVSYSAILSLAHLEPEVLKTSLMRKVDDRGRIIQDTGTGGSWPCSVDRVIWTVAAYEAYLETGDMEWLENVYDITMRTLIADQTVAFDPETGLYRGESSFIDWRHQSYPEWMQCVDIAGSECLGTNAVYYQVYNLMSSMAKALGDKESAAVWAKRAATIKNGINTYLWMPEKGYYAQYLYGRNHLAVSPRSETLGESLCVLFGIASKEQAESIFKNMPVSEFGPTIFWPQIASQFNYHNNAVWPFVTAFYGLAAAKAGNEAALEHAIRTNTTYAAISGTNYENRVASTGSHETQLNSPRQLWSVAGNLGLWRRALLGMEYTPDGIAFAPSVPRSMKGLRTLTAIRYRNMVLDVTVSGCGNIVKNFTLDGKPCDRHFVSAELTGRHSVCIEMTYDWYETPGTIDIRPYTPDIAVPEAALDGMKLSWEAVEGAGSYKILRNGKCLAEGVAATSYELPCEGEYAVIAVTPAAVESFMSEPVRVYGSVAEWKCEKKLDEQAGVQLVTKVKAAKEGEYFIDWNYSNGNGDLTQYNKCSNRSVYVDGRFVGVVVLPQRGDDWNDCGWTNRIPVHLTKGRHTVGLVYGQDNININVETDCAIVHTIRLTAEGK